MCVCTLVWVWAPVCIDRWLNDFQQTVSYIWKWFFMPSAPTTRRVCTIFSETMSGRPLVDVLWPTITTEKRTFPFPKDQARLTLCTIFLYPKRHSLYHSSQSPPSPIKIVKFFMLKSSITWMAKIVKMKCYYVEKCWKFFAK